MRILLLSCILLFTSCGNKKSDNTKNNPKEKQSALLSQKLKNTSWVMPGYEVAGISIKGDKISVSMSGDSFISNGNYTVLEEDPEFVVFNVIGKTNNTVFGLSIVDPQTIKISIISESNSMEAYKEKHEILGTKMKRK